MGRVSKGYNVSSERQMDDQLLVFLQDVLELVLAAGKRGLPAELAYHEVLTRICSGDDFNALIDILVKAGKIRRKQEFLVAASPLALRAVVARVE